MHPLLSGSSTLVISCSPHIVPYLRGEIQALNYTVNEESFTTVQVTGTMEDAIRLNCLLRSANHVFFLLKKFQAPTIAVLYEEVKKLEWEEMIPVDGYFSIHSISDHPEVTNFMFLNMKVKDAIADRFTAVKGKRPDSGAEKSRSVIFLHWKNNEVSLYLDTSGESLTKHGYRKITMKAPLQEALAAAMILATRWDRQSPFINPMCGSGTLAIEAALMAVNKPPGLIRANFGFRHWIGFDEEQFAALKKKLRAEVLTAPPAGLQIIASDSDRRALSAARENAKVAGVEKLIDFVQSDFGDTVVPPGRGVILFNPPYGERLGATDELRQLYASIGDFLKKKCAGYFGYVFTANLELAKHIGLKPKSKKNFLNGSLECKLLEFELYEGSRKTPRQPG
jgi:putative N6-adenine-specific DNA methylase